ncbi:OsmC family protein [Agromyces soli]|uniref:OsmC family protein n=1 Tax=Agromyces soli TaxID=659012 RepID=A0ABY4ANK5_9MICO|nr:OsmC family protein [Agromyces soli]UOE24575.1 OsmC family protein [Agromyces soli]
MTDPTVQPSTQEGPGSVSATRRSSRRYLGRNARGATVEIGAPELDGAHFTPGELLKLALAGCVGLSADRVAARRLGDDFALTVWAHGQSEEASNRYEAIAEELVLDLSGLEEAERTKLIDIMARAIEKACTVGRSVEGAIDVSTEIDGTRVG